MNGLEPPDAHMTDLGNAIRLVHRYGEDLRWSQPLKSWLVWDNQRWKRDQTRAIDRIAKETALGMYQAASLIEDEGKRQDLAKHAVKSEAAARITAMIDLAKSQPGIPVMPHEFDADLWLLNTPNGTLNLQTGELHEHRREDLITKLTAVPYDGDARLELWDNFIADICNGDPQLATFLQRAAGATLSGDLSQTERFFFGYGGAFTGKTSFLEAVARTLGDYAVTADFETFLKRDHVGGPRSDLARLAGARMVKSVEVSEGRRLDEGLLKQITGGDVLTVRDMYAKEFEYLPQFTLWLAANDAPRVRHDDEALWRRVVRVPFTHRFEKPDPKIKALLTDPTVAGSAILRWSVQGCLEWQAEGLEMPEAVKASTSEYREETDPIREFIEDRCVAAPNCTVQAKELYQAYLAYARAMGTRRDDILTNTKFGRLMTHRYHKDKRRDVARYHGIGLRGGESQGELSR